MSISKRRVQALEAMPRLLSRTQENLWRLLLVTFLASLLRPHGVRAQSPSVDPDNNNGVPLSTVNGSVYAWCDYGLQNVAGAGGLVKISQSAEYGSGAGARIHTAQRYSHGSFSALIKCPAGDTSGLVPNFYLSSGETADAHPTQDEIDFEWLGKNKTVVQVTYYVNGNSSSSGTDNGEKIDLGFDCSEAFHEYRIEWTPAYIMWYIDGQVVKTAYNRTGQPFPSKLSFLYSGLWDASDIANGEWAGGPNTYHDAPFVFQLSNVTIKPYADNGSAQAPAPAQLPAVAFTASSPTVATVGGLQTDPPADLPHLGSQAPTGFTATNVAPTASQIAKKVEAVASKYLVPVIIACVALVLLVVGGVTTCIVVRRRKVHAPKAEGLARASTFAHCVADEEVGVQASAPRRPSLLQQVSMRMSMRHQNLRAGSFVRVQL